MLPTVRVKQVSKMVPYFNDDRPEVKKQRRIWVDFVKAKHVFEPSKTSTFCSAHFKPEDFERRFHKLPGQTNTNYQKLRIDDLGICVFPSIHAAPKGISVKREQQVPSARSRRMVSHLLLIYLRTSPLA